MLNGTAEAGLGACDWLLTEVLRAIRGKAAHEFVLTDNIDDCLNVVIERRKFHFNRFLFFN